MAESVPGRADRKPLWKAALALPDYPDPVERYDARTSRFIALSLLLGGAFTLALLAYASRLETLDLERRGASTYLVVIAASTGLLLFAPVLQRLGRVRAANLWMVAIVFFSVTVGVFSIPAGVGSTLVGYTPTVVIASILLPGWAAAAVAVASTGAVAIRLFSDLPAPMPASALPLHEAGVVIGVTAITSLILWRTSHGARHAIAKAFARRRELERRNQELKTLEARFQAIAMRTGQLVSEVDERGRFVYVSPNHREIMGYEPDSLVGEQATHLVHPEDSPAPDWPVDFSGQGSLLFRIRNADGDWRSMESTVLAYRTSEGWQPAYDRDVRQLIARSQAQKLEALGRLASGLSHELNNLMTVISLNVELASGEDPPAPPIVGQHLRQIGESADEATRLVRRLLGFARPVQETPGPVDVAARVQELGRLLRPLVGEDVDFELRADPRTGWVEADASELGTLIMNLVVNARDAVEPGGRILVETRHVEFEAARPCYAGTLPRGSYVQISVEDSGSGMDPETASRIFEPFFTTRGAQGSGLGLAFVFGSVRRARGDVSVISSPGSGTRIQVFLPRSEPTQPSPQLEPPQDLPRGSETVLLVEDQANVRTTTARSIRSLGYRVIEAESAERALEIEGTCTEPIELLVTDVVMPGMSGPQLARLICKRRPRVRVLYVTGYAADAFRSGGPPEGLLLRKPYRHSAMAAHLRAALAGDAPAADASGAARVAPAAP
jgi:PAS domain S-box-containing protein